MSEDEGFEKMTSSYTDERLKADQEAKKQNSEEETQKENPIVEYEPLFENEDEKPEAVKNMERMESKRLEYLREMSDPQEILIEINKLIDLIERKHIEQKVEHVYRAAAEALAKSGEIELSTKFLLAADERERLETQFQIAKDNERSAKNMQSAASIMWDSAKKIEQASYNFR